ncbi:MAG: hypothetical protein H7Y13_09190 [Sphingobacteriaceae bacterium]|nr:hypothetical protein [Sphingobacteriaceae bacterium]
MNERVKQKLDGKKVLFISAKFYHYGEAVYEKIKTYGADVSFYYERDTNFGHVIAANFFQGSIDKRQDRHYKKILKEISGKAFDYLVVIRGYRMKGWFVEAVKAQNPGIQTLLYEWDSLSFWDSDYTSLIPHFDKTLSFDYKDCEDFKLPYAPTFHMDEYATIEKTEPEIDFIFCSNYTDEKYEFVKKFIDYTRRKGYKVHIHLYLSWFKYYKEKLRGNIIDYNLVAFKRLPREDYFKLFCKSKTIVDFSATVQSGLTMRVIDALGSGKRVLTNNANVAKEPGFNPHQIVIYDAKNLNLPDYINDGEYFEKKDYSIDNWLDNLFFATAHLSK